MVGRKRRHDFSVAFSDKQKLHLLRQKFFTATIVLQSCLNVAGGIVRHCRRLDALKIVAKSNQFFATINTYVTRLKTYQQKIRIMIQISDGTADLVSYAIKSISGLTLHFELSKILECRSEELLQDTNEAMKQSLDSLRSIAWQSQQESKILASLAIQGRKDSQTLKALTTIATMYLPASLVAVSIFNGNLILF